MRRRCHLSLHVELENRLRGGRTELGEAEPGGIAHALQAFAAWIVSDKADIGLVLIGRPMFLKIVEEREPVER